jgi:uncharacterized protein YggE
MFVKTWVLLAAAGALGLLALGCTSETTVSTGPETSGITVSGQGIVYGQPDIAVVTLGVQATAATVADARSQASDRMNAMLSALKDGGVDEKDIQTTQFSVDAQYDYSNNRQTIIGFMVNNVVTAKVRDIDKTGELIDAAVTAGGDQARVQGVQFTIDDPAALQDEARKEAMADARARAQTLADAAGATLGDPRSISESGGPSPIFFGAEAASRLQALPDTPIQTGELQVTIDVSVVYELK